MNSIRKFSPASIQQILTLIISIFCISFSNASADVQKTIVVLGDSISAGYGIDESESWVSLMDNKLKEEQSSGNSYRVINASVSGNTTGDGLGRLPTLLKEYSPDIVIIELGGNDGLRGYPVKRMQQNLQRMIDLSQASGADVLLAGIEIPPNYGERYTDVFREAFRTVADNNTLSFLPFILEGVGTLPELMQDDGIHPTAEAQSLLLNNVWPYLIKLL